MRRPSPPERQGWVDSSSADKLRGTRFLSAYPLLVRTLAGGPGDRIGSAHGSLVDSVTELLSRRTPADVLQLRMALRSINAVARSHATVVLDAVLSPE